MECWLLRPICLGFLTFYKNKHGQVKKDYGQNQILRTLINLEKLMVIMTGELFPTVGTENLLPLPEKWCVERNRNNYHIVNELFGEMYSRRYSHNGYTSYNYKGDRYTREQNYLHYPRIEKSKLSKRAVYNRPQKGYKEISVEQLKAFVMQQNIKDNNWYIRGGSELIELMADKTINDGVYQGLNPAMGYYVPNLEEPTKWHSWSVTDLKAQGKKEITVQQFKELLPFEMPEKWFIRGGDNSLVTWLQHDASGLVEYARQKHWGLRIVDGRWVANLVDNYEKSNIKYTEITFDQFFKSLHNKKEKTMASPLTLPPQKGKERPVIGYKLIKNEYREVVAVLLSKSAENTMTANPKWFEENFDKNLKEYGLNFSSDIKNVPCRILERAGVLNLWFEPVYEYAPKLPEIKGKDGIMYKGIYENGQLIYGCARLNVDWFKNSSNRGIGSFTTTNDVLIGVEEVKAIRKYLEHHGWVK